jgi:peptidoglycan/xylan/chitin deacetylase (PgdA/CDA1 family)
MMRWVKRWFNVLALEEAAIRLHRGSLPERALAITFDDGYEDNASLAAPILRDLGLPATFFVCPGFLDGGRMWNDEVIEAIRCSRLGAVDLSAIGLSRPAIGTAEEKRAAINSILKSIKHRDYEDRARCVEVIVEAAGGRAGPDLMMSRAQVRSLLASGIAVGGHTVTHPILSRISAHKAKAEIGEGKAQLEGITGERAGVFAYPNGMPGRDYGSEHVSMVRECGFSCAVSTAWGVAGVGGDLMQLPRFTPWDKSRWGFGLRMLQNMRRTSFEVAHERPHA